MSSSHKGFTRVLYGFVMFCVFQYLRQVSSVWKQISELLAEVRSYLDVSTCLLRMDLTTLEFSMQNTMPCRRRGETRSKYFVMFEAICSIDEISKGTPLLAVLPPRFNHGNQDSQDSADVFTQHPEYLVKRLVQCYSNMLSILPNFFATQRLQFGNQEQQAVWVKFQVSYCWATSAHPDPEAGGLSRFLKLIGTWSLSVVVANCLV